MFSPISIKTILSIALSLFDLIAQNNMLIEKNVIFRFYKVL